MALIINNYERHLSKILIETFFNPLKRNYEDCLLHFRNNHPPAINTHINTLRTSALTNVLIIDLS